MWGLVLSYNFCFAPTKQGWSPSFCEAQCRRWNGSHWCVPFDLVGVHSSSPGPSAGPSGAGPTIVEITHTGVLGRVPWWYFLSPYLHAFIHEEKTILHLFSKGGKSIWSGRPALDHSCAYSECWEGFWGHVCVHTGKNLDVGRESNLQGPRMEKWPHRFCSLCSLILTSPLSPDLSLPTSEGFCFVIDGWFLGTLLFTHFAGS